ncbi:hypothetical protein TorRG33x02_153600 [Trema orientale]|uniref:Uncharacterized protein n=1 Tax=Trema orientale TaxID=63057 RepID=A0A2P5ETM1_TREOI|nr:hypothetical protein TorRG33x02_153600 [Trema orientale]
MDSIEQSMMAYLCDWHNQMQSHFWLIDGKMDLAITKSKPFQNVFLEQFSILWDHFASTEFNKVCTQNSKNRSKQLYNLGQGSTIMTSQMHSRGNPKTDELMNAIDYFEDHHHKSISWRNKYMQHEHAEMATTRAEVLTQAEAHAQTEPREAISSADSMLGLKLIDESQIMSQALGTRSRH